MFYGIKARDATNPPDSTMTFETAETSQSPLQPFAMLALRLYLVLN